MSTLPEDRNRRGSSRRNGRRSRNTRATHHRNERALPSQLGESSRAGASNNSSVHVAASDTHEPADLANQQNGYEQGGNDGSGIESTDPKEFLQRILRTQRQNSPVNNGGPSAENPRERNTPSSSASASPANAESSSQHQSDQHGLLSQTETTEPRDNPSVTTLPIYQASRSTLQSGSEVDTGGQGDDDEGHSSQDRNATVSYRSQGLGDSAVGILSNQLAGISLVSYNGGYDMPPAPAMDSSSNDLDLPVSLVLGHNTNPSSRAPHAELGSQPPTVSSPPDGHYPELSSFTNPIALSAPQYAGPSLSMNPIAPAFVPGSQQQGITQAFTLPRWQPDSEAANCSICDARFGMFLRRHHCRKCGLVVCDSCSPHRITIPNAFIVRPPGDPGPPPPYLSVSRGERGILNCGPIGGGERVRLCNPCVPDPNTTPPRAPPPFHPPVVDGRSSIARTAGTSLDNHSPSASSHQYRLPPPSQRSSSSRIRSASIGAGRGQAYLPAISHTAPLSELTSQGFARAAQLMSRSPSGVGYSPRMSDPGRAHISSTSISISTSDSDFDRPLPSRPTVMPEISEEDHVCPVCHLELPSRALPNYNVLREIHINNCITYHITVGGSLTVAATGPRSQGTPPQRTTWRTRMVPYVATEKDCVDDAECIICLEEFKVGDGMARLECFCRFHRSCIDSWFVDHPGRCPVHQHGSFGY